MEGDLFWSIPSQEMLHSSGPGRWMKAEIACSGAIYGSFTLRSLISTCVP
jgi:hypothetical protein